MAAAVRGRGRRSLNGTGDSPQLRLRLPATLRDALMHRAAHHGVTVSALARQLLTSALEEPNAPATGRSDPVRAPLSGPQGRRLQAHRSSVLSAASAHGLSNVRVFGSVARGDDHDDSDIDLLVDIPVGMGLIALGRVRVDLERILGARVDLIPAADLKRDVALSAQLDSVPL